MKTQIEDLTYSRSYEIITGDFNRGTYYASDVREVTEASVRHVMGLFMHYYAATEEPQPASKLNFVTLPDTAAIAKQCCCAR